jgi:hypothetical protein
VTEGPPEGRPEGRPPHGRVRPTTPGLLVGWGVVGLVGGWLLRPVTAWRDATAPVVTWGQVLALFLVAAILGLTAWSTWRTLHVHGGRLEPHRAVNRLVLAKACALVGAIAAGGYAGYALSWVGLSAELADQRMLRSGVAALAGLLTCAMALLLERACRVRSDDDEAPGRRPRRSR